MQTNCHFSVLVHEQAKILGDKPVLTYREFGSREWKSISWNQFSDVVKQVSSALLNLGVKVQENIGVFSQNAVQYLFTDFGAFGVRAVTVPFYATSSEEQIRFMIADAEVRILFVGEQEQYDKAHRIFPQCPTLERIIIFDKAVAMVPGDPNAIYFDDFLKLGENLPRQTEVEKRCQEATMDDIANILYTSGTTGDSKGVILTHGQYHAAMEANHKTVPVNEKDVVMNFLPYTHVFERGWAILCLTVGARLVINTYPREIQETLREIHPTCMSSVPRFWEKVFVGVMEKVEKSSGAKRALFNKALSVGRRYNVEYLSNGRRPPLHLQLEYTFFNKTVFSLIRKELGLENAHFFPTAGATVSPEVEEFVHSIGIGMMVGYGLTESLATVSHDHYNAPYTIGSVGRPLDSVEVKIGENDEILLRGATITRGYYKREALTAAAFDEDGFFRTGDAGYMRDGELFLKERIKDLFKTSNGKYIAPQMIESKLLVDKFVEQIAVIADQRKFVSALIVPNFALLEEFARENGIKADSQEALCRNPKVMAMMTERMETLQQGLASYERIKRFTLLPKPFSMENGELTNTLKIRRNVLLKNYASEIEAMYQE
ncbi:MAG: long-chain fatty acid--CoA ligase [Prevotella sp.]|nr:long-chain fatty acid--CoA ligase [Prevotella sp.]